MIAYQKTWKIRFQDTGVHKWIVSWLDWLIRAVTQEYRPIISFEPYFLASVLHLVLF